MPKPPLSAMMFACWLAVVGWAPGAQAGDETEFLAAAPPILSVLVLVDAGRETGPVDIPVQLTLSRPADEAFMVPLHVEGDSATAGADFTPVTRALQFERGVMTRTVTIDVRDDPEDDGVETLDDLLDAIETGETTDGLRPGTAPQPTGSDQRPKVVVGQILLRLAHALGDETQLQDALAAPGTITFLETGSFASPKTLQTILRALLEHAVLPDKTTLTPRIMPADGLYIACNRRTH